MGEKKDRTVAWRKLAERLAEELRWCSGSNDFSPGGKARKGWVRGPQKVLERFDMAMALEAVPRTAK